MGRKATVVALVAIVLMSGLAALAADGDNKLDIVETAKGMATLKMQVQAVEAAQLTALLKGDGPFTVFVPNDAAFAALPAGELARLVQPANLAELQGIVKYHIVEGRLSAGDLAGKTSLTTLQGSTVTVATVSGNLKIGGAAVLTADIDCSNGVIHIIDTVLVP